MVTSIPRIGAATGHGLILCLALGGCSNGTSRPAIEWGKVFELSSGAAVTLARSPAPESRLTAAWVSAPEGGTAGRLSVQRELSGTAPVEMVDPLGTLTIYGETPPKIGYGPDGTLYTAYLVTKSVPGRRWPVNALRFAQSSDGGGRWTEPSTVSSDTSFGGSTDDHAFFAAADGTLYLTWLAHGGGAHHTWLSRSEDRGRTWSTPVTVDSGPSCPCCRTALTSDTDGALYVAWRRIYHDASGTTEVRDIAVARSDDHGRTWNAPVRVHTDDWQVNYCPDAGPSIKVGPDHIVHVAWWTGKEGQAGVHYARSSDRGRSFGAEIPLGIARLSRAAHVQLAVGERGEVVAAWDDGTLATPRIVVRTSRDGGRSFGEAEAISAPNRTVGYPAVALRGDTVTVAWQERTPSGVRQDSLDQLARAKIDTVSASRYIAPVGSWRVVARQGRLR